MALNSSMDGYVDIRKITSERPNKHAIEEGKRHQDRIRFHALVSLLISLRSSVAYLMRKNQSCFSR